MADIQAWRRAHRKPGKRIGATHVHRGAGRGDRRRDQWVARDPVVAVAREEPHAGVFAPRPEAVAVILDLVIQPGPAGGLSAAVGWQSAKRPTGRPARWRSMSVPDLAFDLADRPAQIADDLGDRHSGAEEFVKIGQVRLGPRLAGIDVGKIRGRLLTQTQHGGNIGQPSSESESRGRASRSTISSVRQDLELFLLCLVATVATFLAIAHDDVLFTVLFSAASILSLILAVRPAGDE
jgi:hypothetical protein